MVSESLHYPDLIPLTGWTGYRAGTQQRYIAPEDTPELARRAIIVSPLLPRSDRLPSAQALIEQTLAAEVKLNGLEILESHGPAPISVSSGLSGVKFEVRVRAGGSQKAAVEQRIYVLLVDDDYYYGINYLAAEDIFDEHQAAFWQMVDTIRPVCTQPSPTPFDHYND